MVSLTGLRVLHSRAQSGVQAVRARTAGLLLLVFLLGQGGMLAAHALQLQFIGALCVASSGAGPAGTDFRAQTGLPGDDSARVLAGMHCAFCHPGDAAPLPSPGTALPAGVPAFLETPPDGLQVAGLGATWRPPARAPPRAFA